MQDYISTAVDRLNELLPTAEPLGKDKSVILLGPGAQLDSMGFVNFLVAVEEELEAKFHLTVVLADHVPHLGDNPITLGDIEILVERLVSGRSHTS